ncbi:glycosyltransferase [Corynebacterium pelargi]|uniref:Teichuronic acid biosynthesis glycosyltransferase TuaC n=1 Tax=Corynebacterium pelargi TaxID=1471400 RepID=A0A410W6A2_9CORY|nr:glycosyltransferase [Corynebacterium pelargi]QAU51404.1 Putative teichuronic acid biosynthesis glycosyltransferase TuaC [Corynebacterium pelargi]GGG81169.1 hypothetical protein GCM10007338_19790 [Corynebacterium pelargi]
MSKPVVFWQPILSIHQTPLLEEFGRIYPGECYLVVNKLVPETRVNAGWDVKAPENIRLIGPEDDANNVPSNAIHVVSGYVGPQRWLKQRKRVLADANADVVVMVEGISRLGGSAKRAARFAKQWMGRMHLRHHLRGVLAIGTHAQRQAARMGIAEERIYPMLYATATPEVQQRESLPENCAVFVGKRCSRKNTDTLVKATKDLCPLVLIGAQEEGFEDGAEAASHVEVLGSIENERLASYLVEAAVLVLPSWHDGWGAVVNEALACGTPVVCSAYAGAADLINSSGPFRGVVVDHPDQEALHEAIAQVLHAKADRDVIQSWALEHISPEVVAPYLQRCLIAASSANKGRPTAPWHRGLLG